MLDKSNNSNGCVNVLSLFDGMSCGMLAMMKAGVNVGEYYAYEIDKYAIQTSQHNFPQIKQCGDAFNGDYTQYKDIDYLIGGSPCTYWSIAQSPDKRETTASGMGWELFSQYVRALHEVNPKYFIYENNKSMARGIYDSISETFGFEPICINSALVSAQNRQRLYWVGKRNTDGTYNKVDVEQPEDKGILLRDVLDGVVDREKSRAIIGSIARTTTREYFMKNQGQMSFEPVGTTKGGKAYCLSAGYSNGSGEKIGNYAAHTLQKGCKSMVAEPVCMRYERSEQAKQLRKDYESGKIKHGYHEYHELQPRTDGKTNTVSTVLKDNPICEPVCVASRGRYTDQDTIYQHYEARTDSKTNAITTVQKDNLIGEPVKVCSIDSRQGNRIYSVDGKAVSQVANGGGLGGQTGLYAQPVTSSVQVGALPRPNGELSQSQAFRIYDTNAKSVTLKAGGGGAGGKTGLYAIPVEFEGDIPTKAVSCSDGKTYTVYEVKNGQIVIKGKIYPIKLVDGYYIIRKLTVSECKRLQTVPEWYEFPVSDTQAYKMLGNGWTVDVIAHLIKATR